MEEIELVKEYFLGETKDFIINDIKLETTKASYVFNTNCYRITTDKGIQFYVFCSDELPWNLYPILNDESLDEYYYKHIGLMIEKFSSAVANNFLLEFIYNNKIFPIIERKILQIEKEIDLSKEAYQLKGLANQIRDCYVDLSSYLMNRKRTENVEFKQDNFKGNYQEFLKRIIPGKESETRRNTINGIADKGWTLISELVHKDSVTVFDLMVALNTFKLVVSITSILITGEQMPFNKIKCPNCKSEKYTMRTDEDRKEYVYVCTDCNTRYTMNLEEIVKDNV